MTDHFNLTLSSLQQKIQEHEQTIQKIKRTINQLAELEGRDPVYADADLQVASSMQSSFRSDQFFGKPLATSVTTILEQRQSKNLGAAPADDLYAALISGGFDFETQSESNAKRMLSISLSKNILFQRTPNGSWGMRKWYKQSTKKKADNSQSETTEGAEQKDSLDNDVENKEEDVSDLVEP